MCGWLGDEIDFGAVNQSNVFGYFVNQFGDSPPGHKGEQPKLVGDVVYGIKRSNRARRFA